MHRGVSVGWIPANILQTARVHWWEPVLLSYHCELIGFPFALVWHVRLRNTLLDITKYMCSTGIIRNFGRLRGLWNVLNRLSRLNFSRESSFKGILNWALVNIFKDLYFLSYNYCDQNKTAHSEIYQWHHHLNLPLDQKSHLLPQAHHSNVIKE